MELKFYEKIGVKHWKRFLMWLMAKLTPDTKHRKGSNYYLKYQRISAVKQFKKMLILNGTIHFVGSIYCLMFIMGNILGNNIFSFSTPILIVFFGMNLYCLLLQRYNWIRINKVLKKKKLIDQKEYNKERKEEKKI